MQRLPGQNTDYCLKGKQLARARPSKLPSPSLRGEVISTSNIRWGVWVYVCAHTQAQHREAHTAQALTGTLDGREAQSRHFPQGKRIPYSFEQETHPRVRGSPTLLKLGNPAFTADQKAKSLRSSSFLDQLLISLQNGWTRELFFND